MTFEYRYISTFPQYMANRNEQFCYCSYDLCNGGSLTGPPLSPLRETYYEYVLLPNVVTTTLSGSAPMGPTLMMGPLLLGLNFGFGFQLRLDRFLSLLTFAWL